MKFELRAVTSDNECRYSNILPNEKYSLCKLKFGDIKSVLAYQEASEYQTILGEKEEISKWYVDINTIEDLVALENEVHNSLIINGGEILIYDGFLV